MSYMTLPHLMLFCAPLQIILTNLSRQCTKLTPCKVTNPCCPSPSHPLLTCQSVSATSSLRFLPSASTAPTGPLHSGQPPLRPPHSPYIAVGRPATCGEPPGQTGPERGGWSDAPTHGNMYGIRTGLRQTDTLADCCIRGTVAHLPDPECPKCGPMGAKKGTKIGLK